MKKLFLSAVMYYLVNIASAREQISIVGSSKYIRLINSRKIRSSKSIQITVVESTGSGGGLKMFVKVLATMPYKCIKSNQAKRN